MAEDRIVRARLTALREGLLAVHKALLAIAREGYEREHDEIEGPGKLLQLLIGDPYFAWLHPVSELAARADELLEEDELPDAEVTAIAKAAEKLLTPDENGTGFAKQYFDALQSSPEVVMAHAGARRAVSSFGALRPG